MYPRDTAERGELRLGRIIAVSASQAIVLLAARDAAAPPPNDLPLEMSTLVKMHTRVSTVYGMVTGLRLPLPSLERSDKDLKLVELELVGEIRHTDTAPALFSAGSPHILLWMSQSISLRARISRKSTRVLRS
jgi:hypothetical protein